MKKYPDGLSPLAMSVAETIRKYEMIRPGDGVVVGLSGGPDSVCLISILAELQSFLEIRSLHAVQINHGLRGAESEADQSRAEEIAAAVGATFDRVRYNVREIAEEEGAGEEETGRRLRYAAFERFRQQYDARRIAVAHNRNDQAETVLMRLLRGTGIRGLSGIDWIRADGVVIRPLLGTGRDEIESYCRERKLEPRIDSTNLQPVYTRNRVRLELLPRLERDYNPKLQEALFRLAEQAGEIDDFVRAAAVTYLDGGTGADGGKRWREEDSSLDPEGYGGLHPAAAGRTVLEILDRIGAARNITADGIDRISRVIRSQKEPMETDITDGFYVRKMYGRVFFLRRDQFEDRTVGEAVPLPVELLEKKGAATLWIGGREIFLLIRNGPAAEACERETRNRKAAGQNKEKGDRASTKDREILIPAESAEEQTDRIRVSLDLDRLLSGGIPVFRNRRPGDRFRPIGMKGRKKLQDHFTDRKIPRQNRDTILLLAEGSEIFLAGAEVSGRCAVTEESRRILIIEYARICKKTQNNLNLDRWYDKM